MARYDVDVYNEATGWTITSKGLAGQELGEIDSVQPEWKEAVENGVFVPVALVQDDPVTVRVVVDEPLAPNEEEEWVGHFTARLRVPDGALTLTGGMEYLWGEEMDDYTEYVSVPPGDCRLDVYTYLPWLNGEYCLQSASDEPLGAYFRRTRPGQKFPDWLASECFEDPEIDPGHEDEWDEEAESDEDEDVDYVTFLLHLQPVENWDGVPSAPLNKEGWVDIEVGARQPERCPLGIRFYPPPDSE